ncbi:hypothetical protein BKA59DRAFT_17365 [Fusarium tricinctum]|uniref:Uncharacterized protein n=1 Tax=Fusarium tricinctum TaxID=61284 RepID=A0A8K0SBG1_9HYPO|nr:hypothetical protein BKA59DRAFT_17365 [Fusarium tricinctum]
MSGLINKVKDALHSDKDKTHEHSTHEQTTGAGHTTGGIGHRSDNVPEGTHGTHNSRVANAADPRFDSDRDHRANPASNTTGGLGGSSAHTGPTAGGLGHTTGAGHTAGGLGQSTGAGHTAGGLGGSSHTAGGLGHNTGAGHTAGGLGSTGGIGHRSENLPEGTVGPHGSRVANAADPRYDSDRDHRANPTSGGLGQSTGAGHTAGGLGGSSHTAGGLGHTTGAGHTAGGLGSTGGIGHRSENLHEGTHSGLPGSNNNSRLHEGTHTAGGLNTYDQTTTGTSGLSSHGAGAHGPNAGLTGTHGPNSGLGGSHGPNAGLTGGRDAGAAYGSGPGPAENTAGPHKSDLLNKADPRVDSNLDGSKTIGKEKTFEQSNDFAGRDPTDAAQVPPSVLQKHVPTEIAHDDPSSDHGRRHSSVNKEHHTGL